MRQLLRYDLGLVGKDCYSMYRNWMDEWVGSLKWTGIACWNGRERTRVQTKEETASYNHYGYHRACFCSCIQVC